MEPTLKKLKSTETAMEQISAKIQTYAMMEAEHMMLKMEHEGCKGEIEKYKSDIQ